jgi:hypothetical protein
VRTDGADRVGDPWDQEPGTQLAGVGPDVDEGVEAALLAYAHRKAARWGAERFAAEMRRRDEADVRPPMWTSEALAPPVEASVEAQVVQGEPATFRPEPPRIGFDQTFFVVAPEAPSPEVVLQPEPLPEPTAPAEVGSPFAEPEELVEDPLEPPAEPAEVLAEPDVDSPTRHPYVPRPPAPAEPERRSTRRTWRGKRGEPEPVRPSVITAPEWARMSPGARRLYGIEEPPGARRAG